MDLVMIFGPPAVGKMTVGHELCGLTGYKLFHNHMTVEPLLGIFAFGSPPFTRLVDEFRTRILEEAVAADLPGLVFTFVWALQDEADAALVRGYVELAERGGARVLFVELAADLDVRVVRNETEFRLDRKRSKRDLAFSRPHVLQVEREHVMNTGSAPLPHVERVLAGRPYLRLDNTRLEADEVARRIIADLIA